MRIDHIELTNFKNFGHLKVDFQPGVNLLVGGNGSGKTSLLEGINIAIGYFFNVPLSQYGRPVRDKEIRLVNMVRTSWTDVNPKFRFNECLNNTPEKDWQKMEEYSAPIFRNFGNIEDRTIAPLIAYYSTQRLFIDSKLSKEQKYDAPNGRRNGYIQCLEDYNINPILNEWLGNAVTRRATKQIHKINGIDHILENVEQAIKNTLKDFLNVFNVKIFQDPDFQFDVFLQFDEETPLPISYYSDGFRNLIYLVMDMVWRASQLNPWLTLEQIKEQVTGVVTIDEIDLHLHPKWQAKAISLIQGLFPNVQFFITTHSPTVVANFEHGSLYVIDNNEVTKSEEKYFGKAVNSVLRDVLGAPDRHKPTQDKINLLLRQIGNEAPAETYEPLLNDLIGLLGLEDPEIQSALSLIEWNKIKTEDNHAVHS